MQHKSDAQLLREYAQHGVEAAFTELVARHTNLVYSAATRQTDSSDTAAEITHCVFIGLARGARELSLRLAENASLAGWLCRSARNISLNLRRDEFRQHNRERQAMEQLDPTPDTPPDWERLGPILDEAMSDLNETDHDALVMRFFNNLDLHSVGRALGVTEDTAQKRVSRALDKLRLHLARRGIQSTAAALSVVLSANAVQTAPAGLSLAISAAATLAGNAVTASTVTATTTAIAMTSLQKALVTLVTVAVVGVGTFEVRQNSSLRGELQTLNQKMVPLPDQIRGLQQDRETKSNGLATLRQENEALKKSLTDLPKLRGDLARFSGKPTVDSNDARLKETQNRINKLKQCLQERPDARIPEFRFLTDIDYADAIKARPLDNEEAYLAALSNLRSSAEFTFIRNFLNPALTQFAKVNNGQFPTDLSQLQPYFPSPVEDSILERWEIVPASTVPNAHFGDPIITIKAPVDEDWDPRYVVGLKKFGDAGNDPSGRNGWGVISPYVLLGSLSEPAVKSALAAYQAANNGQDPTDLPQILPYFKLAASEQQVAKEKIAKWRQHK